MHRDYEYIYRTTIEQLYQDINLHQVFIKHLLFGGGYSSYSGPTYIVTRLDQYDQSNAVGFDRLVNFNKFEKVTYSWTGQITATVTVNDGRDKNSRLSKNTFC